VNVTTHVAQNVKRKAGFSINISTARYEGYAISTNKCKRAEGLFGWGETAVQIRQVKALELARANALLQMIFIGWNLIRVSDLQDQWPCK